MTIVREKPDLPDADIQDCLLQQYGSQKVNPIAMAYYRFKRIVQDIADWGERMLLTEVGGQDRVRWLQGLKRWFQPNDVVEMAYYAERRIPQALRGRRDSL